MVKRTGMIFLVGVMVGIALLGASILAFQALGDGAQAEEGDPWRIAGGSQGFAIAEWGTGQGPDVSLDQWIESMSDECDIEIIARGVSHVSVYYRCPG